MKKLLIIIMVLLPLVACAQSAKKVTELPEDAQIHSTDLFYIIDQGTTSKKITIPTVSDWMFQFSDSVRSELSDSITQIRSEISGGGNGWAKTGNYMSLATSTDSVGIGTSSPAAKLHVVGNTKLEGPVETDGVVMHNDIVRNDSTVYLNFDHSGVNSQYLIFGQNGGIRSVDGYMELSDKSGTYNLSTIGKEYIALSGITVDPLIPGLYGLKLGGNIVYSTTFSSVNLPIQWTGINALSYFRGGSYDARIMNRAGTPIQYSKVQTTMTKSEMISALGNDSAIYSVAYDNAAWNFSGTPITMDADKLTVPYRYRINTGRLDCSDTLQLGDYWLYGNALTGLLVGTTNRRYVAFRDRTLFGENVISLENLPALRFDFSGGQDYLTGFRNDTTRHTRDTAIAPSWDGLRKYVAANGGGGDVGVSGTPVTGQFAVWSDASTIKGASYMRQYETTYDDSIAISNNIQITAIKDHNFPTWTYKGQQQNTGGSNDVTTKAYLNYQDANSSGGTHYSMYGRTRVTDIPTYGGASSYVYGARYSLEGTYSIGNNLTPANSYMGGIRAELNCDIDYNDANDPHVIAAVHAIDNNVGNATSWAGYFDGDVKITGDLTLPNIAMSDTGYLYITPTGLVQSDTIVDAGWMLAPNMAGNYWRYRYDRKQGELNWPRYAGDRYYKLSAKDMPEQLMAAVERQMIYIGRLWLVVYLLIGCVIYLIISKR